MELSTNAIAYSLEQLAIRAGITEYVFTHADFRFLDLPVYYGIDIEEAPQRPAIFIKQCSRQAWNNLLEMPNERLVWLSAESAMPAGQSLPVGDSIPALFWGEGVNSRSSSFAECRSDGSLLIHVDIIATAIFMLTRWEETRSIERDKHERFCAASSVALKQGVLQRPLVDEYGLVLQAWVAHVRPTWQPRVPKFQIKVTHDIDYIQQCNTPLQLVREVGKDLLLQKSLSQSINTMSGYIFPSRDIYLQGVYKLAELSKAVGLPSAFYFMAASLTSYDSGYDCAEPLLKKCYAELQAMGFNIGFHPSYYTYDNPELFMMEKGRLELAVGQPIEEGRHHYLRFKTPDTWRQWEQAGLKHDLSLGYADEEGFRCGTCHTFQVFDLDEDRLLELYETPLIVMDATLKLYRGMTPTAGQNRILELAQVCQAVNGTFCLLWHNYALTGYWSEWAGAYQNSLKSLARMI